MTSASASEHVVDPHTSACSCGSDHDHGPTGADIVKALGKGFAILTLVIPVMALMLVVLGFVATPTSLLPMLLGFALGLSHLAALVGLSAVAKKVGTAVTLSPEFLVLRVVVEEVLRLAIVLIALVQFHFEWRGTLGLWLGIGAMLVWAVFTTVASRNTSSTTTRRTRNSGERVTAVPTFFATALISKFCFGISRRNFKC